MSHELKTPLNSIMGFSRLLKTGYDEESYQNHAENILYAGEQILKLITGILDFSRLEAGITKFNSNPPLPLESIITICISGIEKEALKKNIKIFNKIQKVKELIVAGDPRLLQQAFTHLLSNAVKFTDTGGGS